MISEDIERRFTISSLSLFEIIIIRLFYKETTATGDGFNVLGIKLRVFSLKGFLVEF